MVYVISQNKEPFMPCANVIARLLLKQGKAKVKRREPFTIKLEYETSSYTQNLTIGVDTGSGTIGTAVANDKGEIVYLSEVIVRNDVTEKMTKRANYRRNRRNRKTRYRKARFFNRVKSKQKNWLPPSIESKIHHTFHWMNKLENLVADSKLHIEVGKFDMAKMIRPDIQGKEYSQGQCYGYFDTRYFVFARDDYTCQCCKKKNKILRTHHIRYRSNGGTDRADNLITVCTDCHTSKNHKKGGIL